MALRAGLDPSLLSKLIHGAVPIRPDDPRIARLAELLGVARDAAVEEIPA